MYRVEERAGHKRSRSGKGNFPYRLISKPAPDSTCTKNLVNVDVFFFQWDYVMVKYITVLQFQLMPIRTAR